MMTSTKISSAFWRFPPELLHEIAGVTEKQGLLALCSSGDRRMGAVAALALYKKVEINTEEALATFCSTVASRADLALPVETLKM